MTALISSSRTRIFGGYCWIYSSTVPGSSILLNIGRDRIDVKSTAAAGRDLSLFGRGYPGEMSSAPLGHFARRGAWLPRLDFNGQGQAPVPPWSFESRAAPVPPSAAHRFAAMSPPHSLMRPSRALFLALLCARSGNVLRMPVQGIVSYDRRPAAPLQVTLGLVVKSKSHLSAALAFYCPEGDLNPQALSSTST